MKISNILSATVLAIGHIFHAGHTLKATEARVNSIREATIEQPITRAGLDIGSGSTKITVATIDPKTEQIIKILYQNAVDMELRKDLSKSSDKTLSPAIETQLIDVIQKMQNEVREFNPHEYVGVATSVFRTAKNGPEFLARVKKATGVAMKIISQEEEGSIGFATGAAVSHEDPKDIIVWDSGAGSFQLSTLVDNKVDVYGAEFAFVPAVETLFKLRNQPVDMSISCNPISQNEALELIDRIKGKLPADNQWTQKNDKKVVAIGDVKSIFAYTQKATGKFTFSKGDVLEAILNLSGKTDQELSHFPAPHKVIIALCLVYAVMDHCGFEHVSKYVTNGNCEGLLVSPQYWTDRKVTQLN